MLSAKLQRDQSGLLSWEQKEGFQWEERFSVLAGAHGVVYLVDRTPSHRILLMHFTQVFTPHCGSKCRSACLIKTCSSTCHHVSDRLLSHTVLTSSSLSCVSTFYPFSSSPLSWSSSSMWSKPPSTKSTAHPQNEEYCPVAIHNPLTGYEPNQLDNFDYPETSAAIFQDESVDKDTEPSYSCDAELDDELVGKALSSPLFIQEREEPANLRQTCHTLMKKVCCQLSPFSHAQVRGDPYTNQDQICLKNGNQVATGKTSESGFSLADKKSKFLLKSDLRSRSTNFKPSLIKEVSRN